MKQDNQSTLKERCKMIDLDKKHDPRNNSRLISELLDNKKDLLSFVDEADMIFDLINKTHSGNPLPFLKNRFNLTTKSAFISRPFQTYIDYHRNLYPEWKKQLDHEYTRLLGKMKREVNIKDFGGVGDGKTDNTEAFKKAIGNGRVMVHIPEGVFITKAIRLPSWTFLVGEGKEMTTIKLHDDAPVSTRLVTNANHFLGNHHIFIKDMGLDWNVKRLKQVEKTSTWGNHSSCLTFAHVEFGWVRNVEAINPGLHCFDVTSTRYNYSGDGYRACRGSKYVWLDHLNGYGFGDDGITTHHSDFILITNCHMCDPSGRAHQNGTSNSNGIEIDDGSKDIFLVNNSTARCFGGVEIKAHADSSAASNVQIAGHLSVNDNRSYNFRHIGHHKQSDPESKTAYNIKAANLISVAPIFSDLYQDSNPRGLVVSAYKNVVINNFLLVGDPNYDYKGNPIIAIQYRARNVYLKNLTIRNFKTAGVDLKVFGGPQRPDQITIANVRINNSAKQGISIGNGIENIKVRNIRAFSNDGIIGLSADTPHLDISDFQAEGYETPCFNTIGN
jgi:hypothetical protein